MYDTGMQSFCGFDKPLFLYQSLPGLPGIAGLYEEVNAILKHLRFLK